MKKYFLPLAVFATLSFVACHDYEGFKPEQAQVETAEEFTDPRDGQSYRVIRVGNQLWMAQNLRYALPGYSIDGAYTWGEAPIEKNNIRPTDAQIIELMKDLAADPTYDWKAKMGVFETPLIGVLNSMLAQVSRGRLKLDDVRKSIVFYNADYAQELEKRILKYAELPAVKAQVGKDHFDAAEKNNKGYVAKYGFLYTFEAAKAAVPEGWRLPTDEDWSRLEQSLGMPLAETNNLNAWRGEKVGTRLTDPAGFAAEKAGTQAYTRDAGSLYLNKDVAYYYWSSTTQQLNDSVQMALIRMGTPQLSSKVWRGTSPIKGTYRPVLYSVRCVKDL